MGQEMARNDGRTVDQLRDIKITRGWLDHAEGSVLVEFGKTRVLCVASFTPGVPRWLKDSGTGWVTSEYAMLPRATHTRSDRETILLVRIQISFAHYESFLRQSFRKFHGDTSRLILLQTCQKLRTLSPLKV